jgi:hypothetical protein
MGHFAIISSIFYKPKSPMWTIHFNLFPFKWVGTYFRDCKQAQTPFDQRHDLNTMVKWNEMRSQTLV